MEKITVKEANYATGKRLCLLLENDIITKSTLPNHGMDFSYDLRKRDFDRYVNFIMSSSYDDIMNQDGDNYVGE